MTFLVYKVAGGPLGYLKRNGAENVWTDFASSDCFSSREWAEDAAMQAREVEAKASQFHPERMAHVKAVTFSCEMRPIDAGETLGT